MRSLARGSGSALRRDPLDFRDPGSTTSPDCCRRSSHGLAIADTATLRSDCARWIASTTARFAGPPAAPRTPKSSTMKRSERRAELLGLLQRDYETAREFLQNANLSVDRTRTFGLALIAALIGVTVTGHIFWLGLVAAAATMVVALVDGFHTAVPPRRGAPQRIERIYQLLYKAHIATLSSRESKWLEARIKSFRPGVFSNLKLFKVRELAYSRPYPIFRLMYPLLLVAGVAAGFYAHSRQEAATVRVSVAIICNPPAAPPAPTVTNRSTPATPRRERHGTAQQTTSAVTATRGG